ncbi:MAG: Acylphosphatase [Calditrichaeota bacterium]|nr:Acylphosphatase [Calditrichota bacterium]
MQGVGFRHFVMMSARDRCPHVGGSVRNLPDGRVEVIAEGPERELHALLDSLRAGPRAAVVTAVHDRWGPPRGDFGPRFDVTFYGGGEWSV